MRCRYRRKEKWRGQELTREDEVEELFWITSEWRQVRGSRNVSSSGNKSATGRLS